jgi:MOSC domain-containing protein YiiM
MPTLITPCVVHALRPDRGAVGITAIDKRAVEGPVKVGTLGLYADVQASRKYHGGPEQAVYAYSQEDASFWSEQLGRELHPGWFGENLRVAGLDINDAKVGERWQIGDTVQLEVTSAREPCATFARWVGGSDERGWVKRFSDEGRLGAYFRVIRRGKVQAGDEIQILSAPDDAPTILDVYRGEFPIRFSADPVSR